MNTKKRFKLKVSLYWGNRDTVWWDMYHFKIWARGIDLSECFLMGSHPWAVSKDTSGG